MVIGESLNIGNFIYTGIGSRETPLEHIQLFIRIAEYLASIGYTLRSGGANGADLAFEIGCDNNQGKKEIYIPWYRFNNSDSMLFHTPKECFNIAKEFHPNWDNLSDYAKKLHARNVCQILGQDLKTPTSFIVCYTKDGKEVGGTAMAIRIAKSYNIPVFNVGGYKEVDVFRKELFNFIKEGE